MGIQWVVFTSAYFSIDDSGVKEYKPIGPIAVSPNHIVAYNDHMIRTMVNKIPVMETFDQIRAKLKEG